MRRVRSTRSKSKLFFLLLGGGTTWIILWSLLKNISTSRVISPIPTNTSQSTTGASQTGKTKNPQILKAELKKLADSEWNNYSILVWDFQNFRIDLNSEVIFTAASVNKLPILAALYTLSEKNVIDLDDKITLQKKDVQDYGTGSMRYDSPGTTYSLKTLARLMGQKSDNTAAYILTNYTIGFPKLNSLVQEWGLTQTDMEENKTSNSDMAHLMEKIYNGKIASPAATREMLAFLKDTDFENRLPANLPKSATTYHKIGTEIGVVHDVGIVSDGNLTYYLGVFSSDIVDEAKTEQLIAKISQTVYEYLKN